MTSGKVWSATHQPVCADTLLYRVTFEADRATFDRHDGEIETRTEIVVPAGAAAEVRRVTVSNQSSSEAKVELTSYQEVVLAPILSDRGHRAFGNLFVQTEWLAGQNSLLAMRRPRSAAVKPVWGGHTISVDKNAGQVSCETDRSVFVGRGRTQRNPVAMDNPGNLPGTVGAVLDPVLSLRTTLTIPAGQSASVVFTTFHAVDKEDARRLAEQFSNFVTSSKYFESTSAAEPATTDAAVYQDLAALLLFGAKSDSDTPIVPEIKGDRRDLLTIGITGELPIILARIGTSRSSGRVAELVDLHRYWNLKNVECDLVIITDDTRGSGKLREEAASLVSAGGDADATKKAAGIFVFDVSELNSRQAAALNASARIQINCDLDTLEEVANG